MFQGESQHSQVEDPSADRVIKRLVELLNADKSGFHAEQRNRCAAAVEGKPTDAAEFLQRRESNPARAAAKDAGPRGESGSGVLQLAGCGTPPGGEPGASGEAAAVSTGIKVVLKANERVNM